MAYIYQDTDSSFWNFRTRTPSDILRTQNNNKATFIFDECLGCPAAVVTTRIGSEVKFSLRTREQSVAEIRKHYTLATLAKLWAVRRMPPKQLSHMQLSGLAGLVHDLVVEQFEQNPGERAAWIAHKGINRAVQEGRLLNVPPIIPGQMPAEQEFAADAFGADLTAGINALPVLSDLEGALEKRFGQLCDWVLAENTISIDYATRKRLLGAIAIAGQTAPRRLKDNVSLIYGHDAYRDQYPKFVRERTLAQVFEAWRSEAKPSPSTVSTWTGHLASLRKFVGHDNVTALTKTDIVNWKDDLVRQGKASKTIKDGYLACIKRLLNFEVQNHRLDANVAEKIVMSTKGRAGESMLPYETCEVEQLLKLARDQANHVVRWLPWLAAFSGSRIGEVAQLWKSSVKRDGDMWVMSIKPAPDGGRLKNAWSERDTPIHQALIAEGFLDFVSDRPTGPLFYGRSSGDPEKKHASKGASNRVAEWVRSHECFRDPRKAPSHALRHWFKTELGALEVPDSMSDSICGHGKKSEADKYRHYNPRMKQIFVDRVQIAGLTTGRTDKVE